MATERTLDDRTAPVPGAQPPDDSAAVAAFSPPTAAGGLGAITASAAHLAAGPGLVRGVRALAALNQPDGFDCPGCAWPEPAEHRSDARVLRERRQGGRLRGDDAAPGRRLLRRAQRRRAGAPSPTTGSNAQGRLTEPMVRRARQPTTTGRSAGTTPSRWSPGSCARWPARTRRSSTPPAAPATRPRSSTSSSCASSAPTTCPTARTCATSRAGWRCARRIGVGKGTVQLDDFDHADAIFVIGQNPGTNHPRMLTTLQAAARRGCQHRQHQPAARGGPGALPPPAEPAGAARRRAPAWPACTCRCASAATSPCSRPSSRRCSRRRRATRARVLDHALHRPAHRRASRPSRPIWPPSPGSELVAESGIDRAPDPGGGRDRLRASRRIIACWAMGLTQHRHAVANIQGVVNLLLLRRQPRPARRRRLPGARPQQRAGRPHHGHLRARRRRLPRPPGRALRLLRRRAAPASTPWAPSGP